MQLYYFISADGRQLGPVPGEQLVNCGITPDTLVWGQNMSGWAPANTIPEIVALFTSQPQPTQPQPSEEPLEEPSSSTDDTPIQTKNDIDTQSTPEPQTTESPVSEPKTPEPKHDTENKKGRNVWRDILIIFAIILFFSGIIFLINSNSKPSIAEVEVNGVSFNMIYVEGGRFTMGATLEQGYDCFADERPTHQVTLSDYYIGQTEVTQELWVAVMGNNPSYNIGNSRLPVEQVSWNDCQEFIQKLNRLTGKRFRLPTEAEWEFAARGGNQSKGYKYSGSNRIDDVAWYDGNSGGATHEVAICAPNQLGIYDMSGNVNEWCSDWYGEYSSSSQTDPTGPADGSYRVLRGGSWYTFAIGCRVADRGGVTPDYLDNGGGFRLVCSSL